MYLAKEEKDDVHIRALTMTTPVKHAIVNPLREAWAQVAIAWSLLLDTCGEWRTSEVPDTLLYDLVDVGRQVVPPPYLCEMEVHELQCQDVLRIVIIVKMHCGLRVWLSSIMAAVVLNFNRQREHKLLCGPGVEQDGHKLLG